MGKEKTLVMDVLPGLTGTSAVLTVIFGLMSLVGQFNTDAHAAKQMSGLYVGFGASAVVFVCCLVYSKTPDKNESQPDRSPVVRSEIDALKARLLSLVNRRDEELEALADSNEPAEVKEEKARALLERYNRDVAEA
jgi:hypothetical protein